MQRKTIRRYRVHEQVTQLLSGKITALQALAGRLLELEVLEGDELQALLTQQPGTSVAAFSRIDDLEASGMEIRNTTENES